MILIYNHLKFGDFDFKNWSKSPKISFMELNDT